MTFLAIPRDVELALNDMRYYSNKANLVDTVNITIFDGISTVDDKNAHCLPSSALGGRSVYKGKCYESTISVQITVLNYPPSSESGYSIYVYVVASGVLLLALCCCARLCLSVKRCLWTDQLDDDNNSSYASDNDREGAKDWKRKTSRRRRNKSGAMRKEHRYRDGDQGRSSDDYDSDYGSGSSSSSSSYSVYSDVYIDRVREPVPLDRVNDSTSRRCCWSNGCSLCPSSTASDNEVRSKNSCTIFSWLCSSNASSAASTSLKNKNSRELSQTAHRAGSRSGLSSFQYLFYEKKREEKDKEKEKEGAKRGCCGYLGCCLCWLCCFQFMLAFAVWNRLWRWLSNRRTDEEHIQDRADMADGIVCYKNNVIYY